MMKAYTSDPLCTVSIFLQSQWLRPFCCEAFFKNISLQTISHLYSIMFKSSNPSSFVYKMSLKKKNKQHFGHSLIRATSATLATGGASLISSVLGFSRGTTARGTTARGAGAAALGKRPVEATAEPAASRRLARKGTSGALGFSRGSCFILDCRGIGSFKPPKTCEWKNISSKQERKPDAFFVVLDIPRQK